MEIIIEIIIEVLFYGLYRLIKKTYFAFREIVFGIPKPIDIKTRNNRHEKKYLYKKIRLTDTLNPKLIEGMSGELVEVKSKYLFIAEFRDKNKNPIEFKNELVHEVKRNQFDLIK